MRNLPILIFALLSMYFGLNAQDNELNTGPNFGFNVQADELNTGLNFGLNAQDNELNTGLNFRPNAQDDELNTGFGIGYQLVQYQNDFGFGINMISPYFAKKSLGIRLKTNLMFNQNVIDGISDWMAYGNISLGVVGVAGHINEKIRLYGEGGIIAILPSNKFSSTDLLVGGYGLFGFEFFFTSGGNYFIEIGGVGTGATADKVDSKPIYSNGLTISAGVRFIWK